MTIADQIQQLRDELNADPFGPNSSMISSKISRLKGRQQNVSYYERAATGDYGMGAQADAKALGY